MIAGNAYIKSSDKPSREQIMKLDLDKKEVLEEEEINNIEEKLKNL